MSVYTAVVNIGKEAFSDTTRVHLSKKRETDSTLPPVPATHLFLLPKSANYANGNFSIPKSCQTTFSSGDRVPGMKIVGARRGKNEKIIFVALEGAIVSGENKTGPLAMALNVDLDGNGKVKVSYLKGVYIPPAEKVCGLDLTEIRCKQKIEETIDQLIEDGVAKW
ncbi:Hypothetical predicted protein [Paramuricea clavata]|uniref:Uncharacterized protein n=1 Tax=Paramuricea clavata TaxID=317549 RepID=A0A7D9LCC1_PARCT|nr:Hypothetical predicted protein [Paramuricea clavata]